MTENETITLLEAGKEAGKNWPHGECRAADNSPKIHTRNVPAMTDEMREWITDTLDDEYSRGVADGREQILQASERGELIMFVIGCAVGPALLWFAHRIFA